MGIGELGNRSESKRIGGSIFASSLMIYLLWSIFDVKATYAFDSEPSEAFGMSSVEKSYEWRRPPSLRWLSRSLPNRIFIKLVTDPSKI